MSERYSRLFSLPENLYAEGAPVLISAGALLKDNQTGSVIAQLKLKNIGTKAIKTAKVKLSPLDSMDRPLGNDVIHEYLDLHIQRDEDFGAKNAIRFRDAATRAYSAEVIEIGFQDNTIWTGTNQEWTPLAKQEALRNVYSDNELVKQFQEEYGKAAEFEPKCDRDLWFCFCGAVNHKDETKCHACGSDPNYDLASLKEKCDKRLEAEKAETERRAAEEAAAQAAKDAKARKTKKTLAIVISAGVMVAVMLIVLIKVIIPNNAYNKAIVLMDSGRYEEAASAFERLNGYKDSAQWKEEADRQNQIRIVVEGKERQYNEAVAYLDSGDYQNAIESFKALGSFRDSKQKAQEAKEKKAEAEKYERAIELMNEGKYTEAYMAFGNLGTYADSANKMAECEEWLLLPFKDYEGYYETTGSNGDTYALTIAFHVDGKDGSVYATGKNTSYTAGDQSFSAPYDEKESRFCWETEDGIVRYYLKNSGKIIVQRTYNNTNHSLDKYRVEYFNFVWSRVD